jgi:hypothetical protein
MMRYDVFISYSRSDAARVEPLVNLLRSQGYRVFFDRDDIHVGEDWKQSLSSSIASSRTLVLCWSKEAADSEFVRYELFRAEGLNKRVFPWLLDDTSLPALVSIQGLETKEVGQVALALRPNVGLQLRWRKLLFSLALLLLCGLMVAGFVWARRPWNLSGTVRDISERPLEGVVVEATTGEGRTYSSITNTDGHYSITIPQPQAQSVALLFRKDGYESEHPLSVTTLHPFNEYLKPSTHTGIPSPGKSNPDKQHASAGPSK